MPHNHECHHPDHIRYGPREPSKAEEIARHKLGRALATSSKRKAYQKLLIRFNESRSAKDRAKLLSDGMFVPPKSADKDNWESVSWVHTPYQISFSNIGQVYRDQKIGSSLYRNTGDAAPMYFSFRDKDMVINKLDSDGKYDELAIFPILSLTLAMHETEDEDGDIHFAFSMQHDPQYSANAALESAAL